jgi:hypothetical protein
MKSALGNPQSAIAQGRLADSRFCDFAPSSETPETTWDRSDFAPAPETGATAMAVRLRPERFLESALFWSTIFALTVMLCYGVKAQVRPDGSPTGQKSVEHTVPGSGELLKKALKNAKAVSPDDAQNRAEARPVETTALQNPAAQPKLLPDSGSLPESANSLKQGSLTSATGSASTPEPNKGDKGRDAQPGNAEKPVNESDGSVWEPTGISVSRLFLATGGTNGEVRKVPMSVPVLYESRLLALDRDKQRAIARLLDKLVSYRTRLAAMRKEGTDLLAEWNQIVSSSTPQDLLLSDSPTLIETESNGAGRGQSGPGFEPGKGVSIEVKSTGSNQ